jgi:hypothetical protein
MTLLLAVTVSSMLIAAIMSAIAWRIAAKERRRSDARIAALAADIHAQPAAPARAARSSGAFRAELVRRAEPERLVSFPPQRQPDLFAARAAAGGARMFVAVLAVAFVAAATAAALLLSGRLPSLRGRPDAGVRGADTDAAGGRGAASAAAQAAPVSVPLQLVALAHERDGDQLTVRGIVRNPPGAAPVERLTAVVFAFGADGNFLTSSRAIIESSALRAGGESSFSVPVPGAG